MHADTEIHEFSFRFFSIFVRNFAVPLFPKTSPEPNRKRLDPLVNRIDGELKRRMTTDIIAVLVELIVAAQVRLILLILLAINILAQIDRLDLAGAAAAPTRVGRVARAGRAVP